MSNKKAKPVILIVDDEPNYVRLLGAELKRMGYGMVSALTGEEGLSQVREARPAVVLLDLKLPDIDGLQVLRSIKDEIPHTEVIMMTAHGGIDTAIEAMKAGALDYMTKPAKLSEVEALIEKALERRSLQRRHAALEHTVAKSRSGPLLVTENEQFQKVIDLLPTLGKHDAPVLILGESGTGKEVVAREIHQQGPRGSQPFVVVDCGALKEELLESELFGHVKGAFTGAMAARQGLLELADGGTVFLDEIGDLPFQLQVKLLRFLQFGEFRPVGGSEVSNVDVQVIAATNVDLARAVEEKRFREDLYYRLNTMTLILPPLRERAEDIWPLVNHVLTQRNGVALLDRLPKDAQIIFETYPWPGNVRELENVLRRLIILTDRRDDAFSADELQGFLTPPTMSGERASSVLKLRDVERDHIMQVLQKADGNKTQAARLLGIALKTLYNKLSQYESSDDD